LQAAEVKPKAVCICSYIAHKDRYDQTYLVGFIHERQKLIQPK
jgi:hypothetical protein